MARLPILPVDLNGRIVHDPLSMYKISDEPTEADAALDPAYYGFLDADGGWYIHKRSVSAGTSRYCRGADEYATAWTNRASLGYDYFSVIF